ncbi:hypothetical protein LBMAG41_01600 [Cyanobium sp.]|jgi:hypothetical protein|nr:hypothetical protein LBMAG41_01600 [Cyanobium sp.]
MPKDDKDQPQTIPEPPDKLGACNKSEDRGMPGTGADDGPIRFLQWMRSDITHRLIQSTGILLGAVWGIYTFIYKDILVPSWAPAHINLDLSLTPVEGSKSSAGDSEMTLKITVTNSSTRKVYLLSNTWRLFGIKRKEGSEGVFASLGDKALRGEPLIYAERGVNNETGPILAVGRIFDDDIVHPGETINRSVLIRIPHIYKAAEIHVIVPALTKSPNKKLFNGRLLAWGLSDQEDLVPMLCKNSNEGSTPRANHPTDCESISPIDLGRGLRKFDPLMNVFSDSEQVGIPTDPSEPRKQR